MALPDPALAMEMEKDGVRYRLFTMLAHFGAAQSVTLEELSVETFFPADEATRRHLQALATPEVEARRAIMAKLEQNLRDSGVIIQPFWRALYRSARKGVHGFEMHQSLEQHLDLVWIES